MFQNQPEALFVADVLRQQLDAMRDQPELDTPLVGRTERDTETRRALGIPNF